jgi:hypothetical protein
MVPWPTTKYTIRGKVVASPKFGSWWVLWVQVYSWLVVTPKMLKLCINQLVVWFVWVIDCLSFFLVSSQSSSTPLYPQSAMNQGACPNSLLFHCFPFKLTFESIEELGNVSLQTYKKLCKIAHIPFPQNFIIGIYNDVIWKVLKKHLKYHVMNKIKFLQIYFLCEFIFNLHKWDSIQCEFKSALIKS